MKRHAIALALVFGCSAVSAESGLYDRATAVYKFCNDSGEIARRVHVDVKAFPKKRSGWVAKSEEVLKQGNHIPAQAITIGLIARSELSAYRDAFEVCMDWAIKQEFDE